MKVCPNCAFMNDECFPTCVSCNTVIVDVPSTPSADPDSPEHACRALTLERQSRTRRQIRWAAFLYALVITLSAAFPGMVLSPLTLLFYFLSSFIVIIGVERNVVGQFSASILQGVISVILIASFGPLQPLIFFMLVGHLTLPTVFWHWIDMIHGVNH